MIVVIGRVRSDAEHRAAMLEIGEANARDSRNDPGCLGYRFYEDIEQENTFVFVEEWESEEALQAHFATLHSTEFMRAIRGLVVAAPEVAFHTVASSRGLDNVRTR